MIVILEYVKKIFFSFFIGIHNYCHWNKSLRDDFQVFQWFLASVIVNLYAVFYCQEKICYPLWQIEKIVIKADGKSLNVVFLLLNYMVFLFVCLFIVFW